MPGVVRSGVQERTISIARSHRSERLHHDCCQVLGSWIGKDPTSQAGYAAALQSLHDKVVEVTGGLRPGELPCQRYVLAPPAPAGSALQATVPLYHIGYDHDMAIKGPSAATDVFECLEKFLLGNGNETHLYPLQILCDMNSPLHSGQSVQAFSVGMSVAFTVTTACHTIVHTFLATHAEVDWSQSAFWKESTDGNEELATKLRNILRLSAAWCPMANLEDQVYASISSKKQAALRQPPNLIQLQYAAMRIINSKKKAGLSQMSGRVAQ